MKQSALLCILLVSVAGCMSVTPLQPREVDQLELGGAGLECATVLGYAPVSWPRVHATLPSQYTPVALETAATLRAGTGAVLGIRCGSSEVDIWHMTVLGIAVESGDSAIAIYALDVHAEGDDPVAALSSWGVAHIEGRAELGNVHFEDALVVQENIRYFVSSAQDHPFGGIWTSQPAESQNAGSTLAHFELILPSATPTVWRLHVDRPLIEGSPMHPLVGVDGTPEVPDQTHACPSWGRATTMYDRLGPGCEAAASEGISDDFAMPRTFASEVASSVWTIAN